MHAPTDDEKDGETLDEASLVETAVFRALESEDPDTALASDSLPAHLRDRAVRILDRLRHEDLVAPRTESLPDRLGTYRLLRPLGSGGMGIVYLAEDGATGRAVAIKLIRPEHLYFPGNRERFRREVDAAASLQHENIARVIASDEEAGLPYFAMEFIRGCSLSTLLGHFDGRRPDSIDAEEWREACRSLAPDPPHDTPAIDPDGHRTRDAVRSDVADAWCKRVLLIAIAVARALRHSHERGVLHRDVKPSNILITADGGVCLVDFGLAWLEGDARLTATSTRLGSLPYLPPESIRGDRRIASAQQDVYSLGVTLWEMLTLRSAFGGGSPDVVERRILNARLPRLRSLNPAVSVALETVCCHAIDPDPTRRYATIVAMASDLEAVAAGRPIRARPVGALHRAMRRAQRRPGVVLGVVIAVLVSASALALWAMRERDARRHADTLTAAARSAAYVANLSSAASMLTPPRIDSNGAHRALAAAPDEHRGWEWRHLALAQDSSTWRTHVGFDVTQLRVTPHGLLAAGYEDMVMVDPGSNGVPWRTKTSRTSGAIAVAGDLLAHGSVDGAVILRDLRSGRELATFADPGAHSAAISAAVFADGGARLVTGDPDGLVVVWDVAARALVSRERLHEARVRSLATSRDGKTIVATSLDRTVSITRLSDASQPLRWTMDVWPIDARFVSNDTVIAISSSHRLEYRRLDDGTRLSSIQLPTTALEASVEGRWLAFLTLREDSGMVDLEDPREPLRITEPVMNVPHPTALAVDWGTRTMYVAGESGEIAACRPFARSAVRTVRPHTRAVVAVAIARGGVLSADSEGNLAVTDPGNTQTPTAVAPLGERVLSIGVSEGGDRVLVAGVKGLLRLLDGQTFVILQERALGTNSSAVTLDPRGESIAFATAEGGVFGTDLELTIRTRLRGSGAPVTGIEFDRHSNRIAICDEAGVLAIVDGEGRAVARFEVPEVWFADAQFLDAGARIAVACADGVVRIFSIAKPDEAPILLRGHGRAVLALAVTRDGRLVSIGGYDRSMRVWDLQLRQVVASLPSPTAPLCLAAGGAADWIATGHISHDVQLWGTRDDLGLASDRGAPTLDTLTPRPSTQVR